MRDDMKAAQPSEATHGPNDDSTSMSLQIDNDHESPSTPELPSSELLLSHLSQLNFFKASPVLGSVEISSADCCELFLEYYTNYHPIFPLLPELNTFISQCVMCPLLFWTVIAVAARLRPTHHHLHLRLTEPIRQMAGIKATEAAVPSLPYIQALLILCCWPLPHQTKIAEDPSAFYSAIALQKAMVLGIHRPRSLPEFIHGAVADEKAILESRKTWLGCFIINQEVSRTLGIPCTMHVDHNILQALEHWPPEIPITLKHLLQLSLKSYTINSMLGYNQGAPDGLLPCPFTVIESLDTDLNMMEIQQWKNWDITPRAVFLGAKLQLYSYAWTARNTQWPHVGSFHDQKDIYYISQAYSTAIRLINIWCGGVGMEQSNSLSIPNSSTQATAVSSPKPTTFRTRFESHYFIYAVSFLVRITKIARSDPDSVTTDNTIRKALALLKKQSALKYDQFRRFSDVIEYVCRNPGNGLGTGTGTALESDGLSNKMPGGPHVRSRMSFNVVYEVVQYAKKRFGGRQPYPEALLPADYDLTVQGEPPADYEAWQDPPDPVFLNDWWWSDWDFMFADSRPEVAGSW